MYAPVIIGLLARLFFANHGVFHCALSTWHHFMGVLVASAVLGHIYLATFCGL